MYQINLSVNRDNISWFTSIEEALKLRLKEYYGVMAYKMDNSRLNISIACELEFRQQVNVALKNTLVDMFARVCKMEFLKKNLRLPAIKKNSYRVLLHTLVAFDRECETDLIRSAFNISSGIALDGIYNFKLKELKSRWNDICSLTLENSMFLADEFTFNELLRFLISAINPKLSKLTIFDNSDGYKLLGQIEEEEIEFKIHKEELIYYLVDLAPMELVLVDDFKDKQAYDQIVLLFDAKHVNTKTVEL